MEYKIGENGYLGTIEITEREHIIANIRKFEDRLETEKLDLTSKFIKNNPELDLAARRRIEIHETEIKQLIGLLNNM